MASRGWLNCIRMANGGSTGISPWSYQLLDTGFSTLSLPDPVWQKPAKVLLAAQVVRSGAHLELKEGTHPGDMMR